MQEKIDINAKLGEFVASFPRSRKVFEKYGLDYCCGGNKDIKTAADEKGVNLESLVNEIELALLEKEEESDSEKVWINESSTDIINHIVLKHHAFLRKELPYTYKLLDKVTVVHGKKHGDLLNCLNEIYLALKDSIEQHLDDEENILFPYVKKIENYQTQEATDTTMENYKKILELLYSDHEEAGAALSEIRVLTSNYKLPDDACETFKALYENLQAIEDDLHEHIHLENTVLFPRIKEMLKS